MNVTNNKVSLIFTSILTAINAIVLFTLKVKMVTALTVLLLLFGVLYVLFRVLLFLLVFKGLEQVWSNIRASRKGRSEHDPFDHTFNIKWIDDEVKLLLNEKSSEIVKLKEVEQFRKDFLGSVAHELRTPVFGIQGYIHTLIDGADENEAIRKRFLKKAAKNADSLTAILEDLITISRIETNQVKIEKTAFELIELIDEVY
ncbi:MAG: histidine kinase dimerization/phospho-acceptor domain-containing protein, partial [Bacteroidia bacterium]